MKITIAAILLSSCTVAYCVPITYSVQTTATGNLGVSTFTNSLVTVTFFGDTTNVAFGTLYSNNVGTAAVTVAGIGTATFAVSMLGAYSDPTYNPVRAGIGCFCDNGASASILATFNPQLATYDMRTSIGPLSGTSFIRSDLTYNTSLGAFHLSGTNGTSTYTASTVPEPTTGILLGFGVLTIALVRWRNHLKTYRTTILLLPGVRNRHWIHMVDLV